MSTQPVTHSNAPITVPAGECDMSYQDYVIEHLFPTPSVILTALRAFEKIAGQNERITICTLGQKDFQTKSPKVNFGMQMTEEGKTVPFFDLKGASFGMMFFELSDAKQPQKTFQGKTGTNQEHIRYFAKDAPFTLDPTVWKFFQSIDPLRIKVNLRVFSFEE